MVAAARPLWATLLALWVASAPAQEPGDRGGKAGAQPPPVPQSCQGVEARAGALRAKLEREVSAELRSAAQAYVAKPQPGSDARKAWNDFSAHALLYGDARAAAWAALNALLSGKLGLGLRVKGVGAACYPGSGSVAVMPRKALEDAVRYALSGR
jgi:hypothetical protein